MIDYNKKKEEQRAKDTLLHGLKIIVKVIDTGK